MEQNERPRCLSCNRTRGFWVLLVCVVVLLVCVLVLVTVFMTGSSSGKEDSVKGQCPEKSFSRIIRQRCINFTRYLFPKLSNKDCAEVEEAFRSAFISKDPCNITEQDYQPLMRLVNQDIPCNKVVFWSQTKELAHNYTKIQRDFFTLEDTLLGYMADGLTWCSAPGSADVKRESSPKEDKNCPRNVISLFRNVTSKWFAEKACGEVQVILNGSITNAFNSDSTFARVEIPNLTMRKVHSLHAVLILDSGEQIRDSCSGSSISDLKSILNRKSIAFTCQEIRAASSAQGDLLFLSPARGGALLIALLVTLASWTQM